MPQGMLSLIWMPLNSCWRSCRASAGHEHTAGQQKQEHVQHQHSPLQQQQQQQPQQPQHGQQPADAAAATSSSGGSGVLGHAVGPRWTHQLPPGAGAAAGGSGAVELEYGCEIARIQLAPQQQQQQQQQEGPAGNLRGEGEPGSEPGGASATPPQALQLTLTNGKHLEADLVLLAIGVQPALEWVPPSLERAGDGGLRVNRQAGAGS